MSLQEVADYLHLSVQDVERLVKRGEIPCERQGARTVFMSAEIEGWASQRLLGSKSEGLKEFHTKSTAKVKSVALDTALIPQLLSETSIRPELTSRTRASVIGDMAELAESTGLVASREDLLTSLRDREALCSTALPGGLALLHPRHHDPYAFDESFIVLGRTPHPIPFGAPDGKETDIFFLVCCQDDRLHLHTLARLCVILTKTPVLLVLRQVSTAREMLNALIDAETAVLLNH